MISLDGFRRAKAARTPAPTLPVPEAPPELEYVLQDIIRAHDAQLYYVAVAVALSIPDICAALECDPEKVWTTEKKYVAWFDANLAHRFKAIDGTNFYRLRCGVLHQGQGRHNKMEYSRVIFQPPAPVTINEAVMTHVGGEEGKVLCLNTGEFCNAVIDAARTWYEQNRDNPNVKANMPNLVRYRPEGLAPYIVGLPIIG